MTNKCSIELVQPSDDLYTRILTGLREFNQKAFQAFPPGQDLAIALREEANGAPTGGLWGRTAGGWLAIELIFIPAALRGQGLATRLIGLAETEARRRGCHSAWLDTLNARALTLYERLGYVRFGELKDYPLGSSRYFLEKRLGT
jgi:GNAT superfamily N-acetyltransferase